MKIKFNGVLDITGTENPNVKEIEDILENFFTVFSYGYEIDNPGIKTKIKISWEE